jgi:PAS domain S-box-containing protein
MLGLDSQQQQRALLDNIPDMAWLKDRESRYLAVNPAYLQALGLSENEVLGRSPVDIWPADIADVYLRTDHSVLKSGRRRRYEESRVGPDGVLRWFETIKSPIRDERGRIVGTVGISRDISERKAVADEISTSRAQLRELSHYLQTVREEERARISRELHDELGQTLTAMKLELSLLLERLPSARPPLKARVQRLIELVNGSVADLRRIASDLRPLMLDELGLVAAIRWLTDTVAARGYMAIELTFDREDVAYDGDVSTAAFRIVQEALTNVTRHSGASRVLVAFRHENGALSIEIVDNGAGIAPALAAPSGGHHGLLGMRERAYMLGGSLVIDNCPNGGARVLAALPLMPRHAVNSP